MIQSFDNSYQLSIITTDTHVQIHNTVINTEEQLQQKQLVVATAFPSCSTPLHHCFTVFIGLSMLQLWYVLTALVYFQLSRRVLNVLSDTSSWWRRAIPVYDAMTQLLMVTHSFKTSLHINISSFLSKTYFSLSSSSVETKSSVTIWESETF